MRDEDVARRLYQLYSEMRSAIQAGELRPGDRLPGERALAQDYGISRMAVKRALEKLAAEGLVYRAQGKGTFVQQNEVERLRLNMRPLRGITGITEIMRSQGKRSEIRLIGAGVLPPCPFFAARLNLGRGERIFCLSRLRLANGEPVALENSYLPLKYVPGVEKADFARVSLYDYLDSIGRGVRGGGTVFRVGLSSGREAELLELPSGQAIYLLETTGLTSGGLVVEYTESSMRPDRMELFSSMEMAEPPAMDRC